MQGHRQSANRAAILKEIQSVCDEHPAFRFVPTRIKCYIEPAREPVEHFGGSTANVKQDLRGSNPVFERGMHAFEIREISIEE